ncbi:Isopenicillin N synthase [Neofusicoccum parvum]|nr:Isopenicillin N synthase [Neofusicoccum parvum]
MKGFSSPHTSSSSFDLPYFIVANPAWEIPVIDVSALFGDDLDAKKKLAGEISSAAEDTGFFYIRNHGIPDSVIDAALSSSKAFFQQPEELKERAHVSNSNFFNGWQRYKSTHYNDEESPDHREYFAIRYDPRYDPAVTDPSVIPADFRRCCKGEEWYWEQTSRIPGFKDNILRYWQSGLTLARRMTGAFALALDLPEDYFAEKTSYPDAAVTLNHYLALDSLDKTPTQDEPRPEPPEPSSAAETLPKGGPEAVSIGSHTDLQLFTILWQDNQGGLQVLTRQGEWINAKPVEGALGVNIADYLMRITNDRWMSTVHRVKHEGAGERYSMPFFFGFNLNETCGVLPSCVDEDNPAKYDPISCEDWIRRRFEVTTVGSDE